MLPVVLLLLALSVAMTTSEDACGIPKCSCSKMLEAEDVFLQCANRSIVKIPDLVSTSHNVLGVDLSHNDIVSLPKFEKQHLKILDLHYNRIGGVPPGVFSELGNLEVLDLSHNNIAEIRSDCFAGLKKLLVLNLTDNFLEALSADVFSEVTSLKKLLISGNSLKLVEPTWLFPLVNLEHLDMRSLGIQALPNDTFLSLPALSLLELSGNDFVEVPTDALRSAKALKVLHLEHNPIVTLSSSSFAGLSTIEELHLSAMPQLTAIEDGAFASMTSLRILDLANNPQLSRFSADALYVNRDSGPATLKEVYLAYANLTSLSATSFDWCSVHLLDLRGNPWRCDCSLDWVRSCHFPPELTTHFRCSEPAKLSDLPVTQLTAEDLQCTQLSPVHSEDTEGEHHHGHMSLRLLVVTAGLVALLAVLAVALAAFRHKDIRDWFQNRKRVGSVYYVKAQTAPSSEQRTQV